jgi:ubiquinone/menaquinone biosynthesis C-methylase UbiE
VNATLMTTNDDEIAAEYKRAKQQPWRLNVEHFTLFKVLGDLRGRSVLDLACGEGYYTRHLKRSGAARVVGVDISQGMVDLARHQEERDRLGIDYVVQDVKQLEMDETFDVIVAAYLLNYARTYDELLEMCSAITRHLKPGGRFVTVNNNPSHRIEHFMATRKYGFIKRAHGPLNNGTPVDYLFFLDHEPLTMTTYHLSIDAYGIALKAAGFRRVTWHNPELSTDILDDTARRYWADFLEQPPIVLIECVR